MSTNEHFSRFKRPVGLSRYRAGYNDLSRANLLADAGWYEHYESFHFKPLRPDPAAGSSCPAWSPAYHAAHGSGRECEVADFLVLDLHGCGAGHGFQWLVRSNLAGFIHSTRSDTLTTPRSRMVFLLNRPVNDLTYRQLWNRLAQDVFSSLTNPAHADFRQRYDQPHSVRLQSTLLRHEGNLLHVEGVLTEPTLAGDALGAACQAYAGDSRPESMTPRNR